MIFGIYHYFNVMMTKHCSRRRPLPGQGVVEYTGALCIAGLLVGAVVLGTLQGNWMNSAYSAIVTAAGNMLIAMAAQIGA